MDENKTISGMVLEDYSYRSKPLEDLVSGKITKMSIWSNYYGFAQLVSGQLEREFVAISRTSGKAAVVKSFAVDEDLPPSEYDEELENSIQHTTVFIDKDGAEHLFSLLEYFFSIEHSYPVIMDVGSWSITLSTDAGESVLYGGSAGGKLMSHDEDIAQVIRKLLDMPDLWLFDQHHEIYYA
ncbi:MAG: hypothetical protein LUE27_03115 [Clostridia bacterium]|nr:hypothetical protein [Clostridia bacterium]